MFCYKSPVICTICTFFCMCTANATFTPAPLINLYVEREVVIIEDVTGNCAAQSKAMDQYFNSMCV